MNPFKPAGVSGLYLHEPTGIYYTRYRLGKKRTYQCHETDTFSVAKLRHAEFMKELEELRQAGGAATGKVRTMGDCARVYRERLETAQLGEGTKENYRNDLKRLVAVWPGDFDKALPRNVTLDVILDIRTRLMRSKRLHPNLRQKTFKPSSVNRSLERLRDLLNIAREYHLVTVDHFHRRRVLQDRIWLKAETRRPELPSRADMDRIFDEMERPAPRANYANEGYYELVRARALEQADHARFIAYSGMRLEEANEARFEDILPGDRIRVRGTKSDAADRVIPMTGELVALVAKIKQRDPFRRGKILKVAASLRPIQRACARLRLPKLTHHDLRHYFATVCIEQKVDFLTLSEWMGHSDGGKLLMETYGHLRDEHSRASIKLVSFSASQPQQNAG